LAEFIDGRVSASEEGGRTRYVLARRLDTAKREEIWRDAALWGALQDVVLAYRMRKTNERDLSGFSGGIQKQVKARVEIGDEVGLALLSSLAPQELAWLVRQRSLKLPASRVPYAIREMGMRLTAEAWEKIGLTGRFKAVGAKNATEYANHLMKYTEENGFTLMLWPDERREDTVNLVARIAGGPGPQGFQMGVATFTDQELGLPLTRTNPYRLLELGPEEAPPTPVLPAALNEPLPSDVVMPRDGRWSTLLREMARIAGIDVLSDDYLYRRASSAPTGATEPPVLARKGTKVADALDAVCRRFGYLWWEKDGCCYFRSRCWPRDVEREPSEAFLVTWRTALRRKRAIRPGEVRALAALTRPQLLALGGLTGDGASAGGQLARPDVQQFLRFFSRLSLSQQVQLLGKGLVVHSTADPSFELLQHFRQPRPVLLALKTQVTPALSADQPHWKVAFALDMRWKTGPNDRTVQTPFTIAIPAEEDAPVGFRSRSASRHAVTRPCLRPHGELVESWPPGNDNSLAASTG
jgi:hypothetical protein